MPHQTHFPIRSIQTVAMPPRFLFHNALSILCFIAIAFTSCNATGPANNSQITIDSESGKDDSVFYLDLKKRTVVQPVGLQDADANPRFVQIEVVSVTNPKRYALLFEVYYQPKTGAKTLLGNFSLYPADNPGKFIVATQGKIKGTGSLVLEMVLSDQPEPGDAVKVAVKKMKFRRE